LTRLIRLIRRLTWNRSMRHLRPAFRLHRIGAGPPRRPPGRRRRHRLAVVLPGRPTSPKARRPLMVPPPRRRGVWHWLAFHPGRHTTDDGAVHAIGGYKKLSDTPSWGHCDRRPCRIGRTSLTARGRPKVPWPLLVRGERWEGGRRLKRQVDDEAAKKQRRRWQCEFRWQMENIVGKSMGDSFTGNQGETVPN